jgi:hypothetical protein
MKVDQTHVPSSPFWISASVMLRDFSRAVALRGYDVMLHYVCRVAKCGVTGQLMRKSVKTMRVRLEMIRM